MVQAIHLAVDNPVDENNEEQEKVERQWLETFYAAVGGPEWDQSKNWCSGSSVGDWYGVTLEQGLVTALELPDNGLRGEIPSPPDHAFTALRFVRLRHNELGGSLHFLESFSRLPFLEVLDLEHNSLSGQIPPSLCFCAALEALYLGHNNFEGPIPAELGRLEKLVDINLNDNQLSGSMPTSVGKLRNLRGLAVENNCIGGYLPVSHLQRLAELRVLHVYNNHFEGGHVHGTGSAEMSSKETNEEPTAGEYLSLRASEALLRKTLPECTIVIEIVPATDCCAVQ